MLKLAPTLLVLLAAAALGVNEVSAHAGPAPVHWKREHAAARDALEKRCGSQLAARRAKRSVQVRDTVLTKRARGLDTREVHVELPRSVVYIRLRIGGKWWVDEGSYRQSSSNDSTCLVAPEVTQGPYHILGEIVRQNITENQGGVPLEVSLDFVDIETCKPVQVWVDAWHANATGYYGGYIAETGSSVGGGGGTPSMSGGGSMSMSMPGGAGPSGAASASGAAATSTTSYGATSGADSAAAASLLDTETSDESTFLRGVWQSDEDGHLTMYSIVPGWYSGRAQHFHIKVYPDGYIASNGTFVVNSTALHTGQFFFDNETLTAVAATSPYSENAISWDDRVNNEDDQWYPYQSALGYNADMDITWVGSSITDGLVGSITIGLNMSYSSPELSTEWAAFDYASYLAASLLPSASRSASASAATGSETAGTSGSVSVENHSAVFIGGAALFVAGAYLRWMKVL
ncbi:Aromatic compound dioxygenase [Mycena kentingensis (nom. inval.)]|nr:Aromatic compound dioxygenase [Mycena kentingensis (nom. inval.)]